MPLTALHNVSCLVLSQSPLVFFTADEDIFYPAAKKKWGEARLRTFDGGVFMPWSRGGKVDASTLNDGDQQVNKTRICMNAPLILSRTLPLTLTFTLTLHSSPINTNDTQAVLKAFLDWFALQSADRILYTYQSSFGKTAAESSDAPNLDVNHTRCLLAEDRWESVRSVAYGKKVDVEEWKVEWEEQAAQGVAYDISKVPGARSAKVEL